MKCLGVCQILPLTSLLAIRMSFGIDATQSFLEGFILTTSMNRNNIDKTYGAVDTQ